MIPVMCRGSHHLPQLCVFCIWYLMVVVGGVSLATGDAGISIATGDGGEETSVFEIFYFLGQ
ncbi:hypothetical protein HanXRQr2_Chr06g0238131 [Helianthus annuus]|uniref:Uncharacterized protein n=1 Tax=Helianthus annuus TaxID=4232 RepID=A0A251UFA3_HELAN|nr:hypothetical protein HanXRQr2_Chr06g0238131 [Helianthus annuus]KAJ0564817.1 hypothetical protein HanIR_Chr06g0255831 [Helianthus annuus]KAJ0913644.1 hypothetical protein HanPSC8_Chr06g0229691 [Helianthus annuus]